MDSEKFFKAVDEAGISARQEFEGVRGIDVIDELKFVPSSGYAVSSYEEVLRPIVEKSDAVIVAGAFFGDEGKGKITDAIANDPSIKLVVRANSGENAGHTVFYQGKKYVFHLVPSGILVEGKINLVSSECRMDPVSFMQELSQLTESGVDYSGRLFVENAGIVTPYHKLMDFIQSPSNSSTLRGISPSHASKAKKSDVRLDDLYEDEETQRKMFERDIRDYYGLLHAIGIDEKKLLELCQEVNKGENKVIPDHVLDFLRADDKIGYMVDLYKKTVIDNKLFPKRPGKRDLMQETLDNGNKALIEAAQSFFLANRVSHHHGSSTSADTTAAGTAASANYNIFHNLPEDGRNKKTTVINIIKFESSRVGRGENPTGYVNQTFFSDTGITTLNDLEGMCDDFEGIQKQFMDSIGENGILQPRMYRDKDGKEYPIAVAMAIASSKHYGERGATTKKPRITGLIDCVHHHHVNKKQGPYLSISAIDRGDDCGRVGLTVAYAVYDPDGKGKMVLDKLGYKGGDIIKAGDVLPSEKVLRYCISIIKVMDGWKDSPIAVDKRKADDPLPQSVQDYVAAVEHYTGAKVISIGNGQHSENLIYLKKAA